MSSGFSISVIIPAYNAQKTIRKCIDSVLAQTVTPLEIFVIDDCSTDGTLDLLFCLADERKDMPIFVIKSTENLGPGHARNVGIKKATAKYIALLDADDYWLRNHLELHVRALKEKYEKDGREDLIVSSRPAGDTANPEVKDLTYRSMSLLDVVLFQNRFQTTSVVFQRELAYRADFFPVDRKYAEDLEFFFRIRAIAFDWVVLCEIGTAVLGKHPFASGQGLSSHLEQMTRGVLISVMKGLKGTYLEKYIPLLCVWHCLKYCRRKAIVVIKHVKIFLRLSPIV